MNPKWSQNESQNGEKWSKNRFKNQSKNKVEKWRVPGGPRDSSGRTPLRAEAPGGDIGGVCNSVTVILVLLGVTGYRDTKFTPLHALTPEGSADLLRLMKHNANTMHNFIGN